MQGFRHCVWPLRMHFWAICTQKTPEESYVRRKLLHQKNFNLVLNTTYMKLFLKYQNSAKFPSLCLASWIFEPFYSKNGHNSVENYFRQNLHLFLRICIRSFSKITRAMQGSIHCVWPMGSGFRDTSRFSKLPYLGMNLASCCTLCRMLPLSPKFHCICSTAGYF